MRKERFHNYYVPSRLFDENGFYIMCKSQKFLEKHRRPNVRFTTYIKGGSTMSEKVKYALKVLLVVILVAVDTFLLTFFFDSCKTFDFSAEKLDVKVQSQDLIEETFDQDIENLNGI